METTVLQQDQDLSFLIEQLSKLPQVQAIALGGSRAKGQFDSTSDYDLYVYTSTEIPAQTRKQILGSCCRYMEINNQFWETEDDCTLNNGIDIDIIYRNLEQIADQVEQVRNGLAYNGYTTCLWDNIFNGIILYDSNASLKALQSSLAVPYPETLQKNIISKNLRLLTGNLPSYDKQIKKAVARGDLPSISHRTAAFLESYFDILFAMNKMLHPGEKRMMEKLQDAQFLPVDFQKNLESLFQSQYSDPEAFLSVLDTMIQNIQTLAAQLGFVDPPEV